MDDIGTINHTRTSASSVLVPVAMTSEVRDWITLLKPRVVSLVVFTGAVGVVMAPGHLNPVLALTAIICIAMAAGAAGAINMWYDRDIDAIMRRTAHRPIPGGRIEPGSVLAYGVFLAAASVILMFLATNTAASLILVISIFFYVVVYTMWLKRRTPQNIVIGGAAGAFPPMIGWAAVTGQLDVMPLLMFGTVLLWTPPHFWALSLYAHEDYARAGVPMLPVVAGAKVTRRQIMIYTVLLSAMSIAPWVMGLSGPLYGLTATVLSVGFLASAWQTLNDEQDPQGRSLTGDVPARRTFRYSLIYLFVLFTALGIDHAVR